jgi:cytochrome c oxidase subunit II
LSVTTRLLSRLAIVALFVAIAVLLSGCGIFSSPQNTFAPAGTVASDQKNLLLLVVWPALAVLALVWGLLVYVLFRYRRRKGDDGLPVQTHGNNKLELGWTIAPILLLAAFVPPTISGIIKLGSTPANALPVQVNAFQWNWAFEYPQPDGTTIRAPIGSPPEKPSELHIPVNRKIDIRLHSADVIHSFWVPKLAGKIDVIPGRENHMWIEATQIGSYSGECAEFCGIGHATMRFIVVVQSQQDFDAWLKQQAAAQSGSVALSFHGE